MNCTFADVALPMSSGVLGGLGSYSGPDVGQPELNYEASEVEASAGCIVMMSSQMSTFVNSL